MQVDAESQKTSLSHAINILRDRGKMAGIIAEDQEATVFPLREDKQWFLFLTNMKKTVLLTCIVTVILHSVSCSEVRHQTKSSDIPASRTEAEEFIRNLDAVIADVTDDISVARTVRSHMRGRLLSAGLSHKEIQNWIESPLPQKTTEGEKK